MKKNLKIYQINSYKALTKKNYTKYIYRGRTYGKAKLVLQVLKDLLDGSYWDFDEFKSVFKKTIQGSFGVFITFENFKEKYQGREIEGKRRFFTESPLRVDDVAIHVCSQWGHENLNRFLELPIIKELGIKSEENYMETH